MKLGAVTKLDKENRMRSKKFNDDVMSAKCGGIVIFLIYGQFGAIWKQDFGRIVCKISISINSNYLS